MVQMLDKPFSGSSKHLCAAGGEDGAGREDLFGMILRGEKRHYKGKLHLFDYGM